MEIKVVLDGSPLSKRAVINWWRHFHLAFLHGKGATLSIAPHSVEVSVLGLEELVFERNFISSVLIVVFKIEVLTTLNELGEFDIASRVGCAEAVYDDKIIDIVVRPLLQGFASIRRQNISRARAAPGPNIEAISALDVSGHALLIDGHRGDDDAEIIIDKSRIAVSEDLDLTRSSALLALIVNQVAIWDHTVAVTRLQRVAVNAADNRRRDVLS